MKRTSALILLALGAALTARGEAREVAIDAGECWWGLATTAGTDEPLTAATQGFERDLRRDNYSNQAAPLLVSSRGRYVWSDKAFKCTATNGTLVLEGDAPFEVVRAGSTLRAAYLAAAAAHFPPSGKTPDLALVAKPQWNTWVELTYNQNERDVLKYAADIAANGFPQGGVIMIDDTWQLGYGVWQFDPRRFADPKGMCDKLHAQGWKVMLWVCPFVSMDSPGYRELAFGMLDAGIRTEAGGLVCQSPGDPKPVSWWNGKSALVDFSHPRGAAWFARELRRLVDDVGVDGFKLDGGDADCYKPPYLVADGSSPSELCEKYAAIGLKFPLNEYRACFKMGGQPLVQRLCDKEHSWEAVRRLIPEMAAAGLLGHSFVCPDMIGSGSWTAFSPSAPHPYDPELFVRSAQVHALAPMMQFSAAPWRLLDARHLAAVRRAAWTRMKFADRFVALAKECARTGEPMLRNMEYAFPGHGWEKVADQFMMGDFLLVAPQTVKGAPARAVVIPPGRWRSDEGEAVTGPCTLSVGTPLERLPFFVRE
ncbi:MAG: glycoside hydrolase [Kiritimatiellae bacterium]|nr:glycoside hydrolase [Kiritimatiellia bacterium]